MKDPYILLCAGAIAIGNIGMAVLEPTLPIRMLEVMRVDPWQLGEYAERKMERERKTLLKINNKTTKQPRNKQTTKPTEWGNEKEGENDNWGKIK